MSDEYPLNRRRHPRIKVNLKAVLTFFDDEAFSSSTRDISVGGLSLEKEIPSQCLGSDCLVQILGPLDGESIDLKCRIFDDRKNPRRMQFIDPDENSLRRLLQWALKAGSPG